MEDGQMDDEKTVVDDIVDDVWIRTISKNDTEKRYGKNDTGTK
ncbi:MAG: hypothetical protein ACLUTE_06040 [Dorea longicatena]